MMLRVLAWFLATLVWAGCAHSKSCRSERPFQFASDTFSFSNQLVWQYGFTPEGKWKSNRRSPSPDYTHHCFVVARSARQFFQHARFAPDLPKVSSEEYRRRVQRVISRSQRQVNAPRIVIPGYAHLREFSAEHESILKQSLGGAWKSYLQRGHWRMLLPFTDGHQRRMSRQLLASLEHHCPPVIHLVRFPSLAINHAAVLFDARESSDKIVFSLYDPNQPEVASELTFDRQTRRFHLPQNDYFRGGRVDVYQIYHSPFY